MLDFEKIKMVYKLGRNLSLSDIQVLLKAAKKKSYAPGEHIITEGETKNNVYFIQKGLVRLYKINDKGDEITTLIRWENKILACADIILFNKPSELFYETLEPTDVLYIDYDILQTIISNNPKLEANRKFILQNMLKEALERIDSLILLTPEERYINYTEENPDIVNRVPNKFIANVLGITPVSLSRIRKRIVTKNK